MKKQLGFLALIGMLFFSSCLASLHPLYTKDTQVFERSLLGLWKQGKESFLFEKAGKQDYYKLTYEGDNGEITEIEAHLVKLEDHYYLDFQRWTNYGNMYDFNILAPQIDVHNFARIVWDQKQLELILFDGEKIVELLEQRRARIKHEEIEDEQYVLTAKPRELQEFVIKYADELLDFSETVEMTKVMN